MFKRILVANRGEIALRIFRACRELGIETVAIFSEADRGAAYLALADEAYCVGPPKAADSYLKIDRVISAAEIGNVQAIHPGYGFLAENAHFAEVCRSCNIEFIGPSHEAMQLLGDKNAARCLAKKAGVPTVPGSEGLVESEAQALAGRPRNRLPRARQGVGRRRRSGNAAGAERPGVEVGPAASRGRGGRGLRQRRPLPGEIRRATAARRSPDTGRPPRPHGPPVRARLHDSAPPPETGRGKPRSATCPRKPAAPCARPPSGWSARPTTPTPARSNSSSTARAIITSSNSTPESRSSIRSPRWSPGST